jgi:putative thiazole/oxazole-modified microcin (TOMM)-like peptide
MYSETEIPVELDWRFAELVVRAWAEPELVRRYAADPVSVLAEFGLSVADAARAPRLEAPAGVDLSIEDMESADAAAVPLCYCNSDRDGRAMAGVAAARLV